MARSPYRPLKPGGRAHPTDGSCYNGVALVVVAAVAVAIAVVVVVKLQREEEEESWGICWCSPQGVRSIKS